MQCQISDEEFRELFSTIDVLTDSIKLFDREHLLKHVSMASINSIDELTWVPLWVSFDRPMWIQATIRATAEVFDDK